MQHWIQNFNTTPQTPHYSYHAPTSVDIPSEDIDTCHSPSCEVPIPDPVHHQNRGNVAVPALITPHLFVPRVILPRHRIHTIANLLCNYNHG